MKIIMNWLPSSMVATRAVARRVESTGAWGLGVCDSPNYDELYASCACALASTDALHVITSVTNPITRQWGIHASAVRAFAADSQGRFFLGLGTGDSAVRTDGGRPATLAELRTAIERIRDVAAAKVLIAASGPRGTELTYEVADGLIAGVGTDPSLLAARSQKKPIDRPFDVWASVRCVVRDTDKGVAEARGDMLSRAISAGRFNLAGPLDFHNIPDEMEGVLRERFARYDFHWHGRSINNPNATLFVDRPDIEEFLLNRFSIIGTPASVLAQVRALSNVVDGIVLSLRFESVEDEIDRVGDALAPLMTGSV
jgi:alkanesulfonate monooxygenase SsuD/methylene tetrahydromethanopterin reductase-like flavin-dependent oxidoreductase (luciferase family)